MSVIQRSIQVGWRLRVFFTEDVFAPANLVLKTALGNDAGLASRKALVVLDESLAHARPDLARQVEDYFPLRTAA